MLHGGIGHRREIGNGDIFPRAGEDLAPAAAGLGIAGIANLPAMNEEHAARVPHRLSADGEMIFVIP